MARPRLVPWQQQAREALVRAWPSWLALGTLFAPLEQNIPLQVALRFQHARGRRADVITPSTARWRLFVRELHNTPVDFRPPGQRGIETRADAEVRLRTAPARCARCNRLFAPTTPLGRWCSSACGARDARAAARRVHP